MHSLNPDIRDGQAGVAAKNSRLLTFPPRIANPTSVYADIHYGSMIDATLFWQVGTLSIACISCTVMQAE